MAEDIGRRAATVAEARELLGLPKREAVAKASRWPSCRCVSDVRILDLTRLLPGGFCSLLLADLGADVVKVEDTGDGRLRPLGAALLRRRRAPGARHPLGALPLAQPQQALDPPRPEVRTPAARRSCASPRTTTSCSRASAPASSTGSASATSALARGATRASSTARSPATGRRARTPRPRGPRHELPRR